MYKPIFTLFLLACLTGLSTSAQSDNLEEYVEANSAEPIWASAESGFKFNNTLVPAPSNGAYDKQRYVERKALPYPKLREADVMLSKRVWRVIDTRDLLNASFNCEFNPLLEVMIEIAKKPEIEIYEDDAFINILPKSEINDKLKLKDTVDVYNFEEDDYMTQYIQNQIDLGSFDHFRIKEDWIFDSLHSRFESRIIAIAPVRKVFHSTTDLFLGYEVLFWMHYPTAREELAKYMAYHPLNDDFQYSWQQLLDARWFKSIIMKDTVHDPNNVDMESIKTHQKHEFIINKLQELDYQLWKN